MVRSGLLGLIRSIVGLTLVCDISDVSRVGIPNGVFDNLGTTIRKSDTVFTRGSITITVFILRKAGTRVVISDSISILVDSGAIISGLMVSGCWVSGLVGGSWVDNGGLVDNWGRFVDRGGFVGCRGGVVDWGWVVDWGGFVDRGSMVDWGRFVGWGRVVDGSGVVDGSMGMVDSMGKSMVSSVVS
jgi:hypothetical protein